jgi:hypothetical protein
MIDSGGYRMQSVGYWEAWSLWWSGQKVDGMQMWGLPLLWWGRAGKLMQFGGGLIVILDLIGSGRLRLVAGKVQRFARTFSIKKGDEKPSGSVKKVGEFVESTIGLIAYAIVIAAIILIFGNQVDQLIRWQESGSLIAMVLMVVGAMVATVLGAGVWGLLLWAAYFSFIVLAWLFKSDRPGHPMRWVAFLFVVAGFHFDLLAS